MQAEDMKTPRYAESRQKACQSCVAAKAKCDRKPRCSRCTTRDMACVYSGRQPGHTEGSQSRSFAENSPGRLSPESSATPAPSLAEDDTIVKARDLVCPINADSISIRWMNAYVPTSSDQATKTYPPVTMLFLRQMLKSYAGMAIQGKLPPFVHPAQLLSAQLPREGPSCNALMTCLNVARACEPEKGTRIAATIAVKAEMDRLYDLMKAIHQQQGVSVNSLVSLSIFQSYLLYALLLFFQLEQQADAYLRQAVVALQDIACMSAQHGLVCSSSSTDPLSNPPLWMAWIVAEAKRRTLYTMYLFDSVLSAHDGLPTYLGIELRGLPAPSSKALWQASSAEAWQDAYSDYRNMWHKYDADRHNDKDYDSHLRIDELWAAPVGTDSASLARRRRRVDQWLEGVDEYGVMLYTVTSCTHGVE